MSVLKIFFSRKMSLNFVPSGYNEEKIDEAYCINKYSHSFVYFVVLYIQKII